MSIPGGSWDRFMPMDCAIWAACSGLASICSSPVTAASALLIVPFNQSISPASVVFRMNTDSWIWISWLLTVIEFPAVLGSTTS